MRVMWVCNIPVMRGRKAKGAGEFGGWMSSMAALLMKRPDIELMICYPQSEVKHLTRSKCDGISFCGFYVRNRNLYDKNVYSELRRVEKGFSPDLIHLFGTEFPHALSVMKLNPEKTLVDIQGLIGVYAEHYFTGLPASLTSPTPPMFSGRRTNPIYQGMLSLKERGRYEKATWRRVRYATGRTEWDYACAKLLNPQVEYFTCNRVLRESFYQHEWNYENCRKHSIMISQADYPVKGFHIFLKALRILQDRYSDIHVTVAGRSLNLADPEPGTYDSYIKSYIYHYHMEEMVEFAGILDEQQMCGRYLQANVAVVPSLIENAPNSLGEAMIMGVPCVAANVGGVNNLLEHGSEGFLYQPDAAYMLAHYIGRIFDEDDLVEQFSERAKKRAHKTHDRERNVSELLKIYETVTGNGKKNG